MYVCICIIVKLIWFCSYSRHLSFHSFLLVSCVLRLTFIISTFRSKLFTYKYFDQMKVMRGKKSIHIGISNNYWKMGSYEDVCLEVYFVTFIETISSRSLLKGAVNRCKKVLAESMAMIPSKYGKSANPVCLTESVENSTCTFLAT